MTTHENTYANQGACRRAAKRTLGADAARGVDFEMTVDENGRWSWRRLEGLSAAPTKTREEWLRELMHRLHETVFAALDAPITATLPSIRVSCSFPGGGRPNKRIGECWSHHSSADGTTEMMVSPVLDDPMWVAATLAHEMVHAYVGVECGHKGPFRTVATAIGLEGKMTATYAGEKFKAAVQPLLDDMGAYPHAAISLAGRKKKQTYLLKVSCTDESCGTVFRITQKFVDHAEGELTCPVCQGETTIG